MFLYEKKIIYLSEFKDGAEKTTAGFIKLLREENAYILDIHIRSGLPDDNYMLSILMKNKEIAWGNLSVKGGNSAVQRQIELCHGMICVGGVEYDENELQGILICSNGQCRIAGYFGESDSLITQDEAVESVKVPEKEDVLYAANQLENYQTSLSNNYVTDEKVKLEEPLSGDKWEQLQKCYQNVHPFGDQRMFLTIEPKDFVILQAPFQKLVNNSFLLHGFYNYRHLILGPDKDLGNGKESRFYLGVPGTYFEREKMVAVMFGFEGFECDGAVEVGKFGYYMRRVEL